LVSGMRLNALDWLNFFLADVRGRLGPYVNVFLLTEVHWSQACEQWPHRHHGAYGGRRLYRPHTGKAGPDHRRGIRPVGLWPRDRVVAGPSRRSGRGHHNGCPRWRLRANHRLDNPRPVWPQRRIRSRRQCLHSSLHRRAPGCPRAPPTAPIGSTAKALRPPTSRSSAFRLRGSIRPPGSIAASARLVQPNPHRFYGAGEASIVARLSAKKSLCGSPSGPSRRRTLSPRGATQSRSSTGTTADGFDRQFGIGRAGDAPRHMIGNVEALCQSIDPGRVFVGKSLQGRGPPRRFAEQVQCLHAIDIRHVLRRVSSLDMSNIIAATAHVISLNMKRRHLDESQRTMLATRIATLGDGQRQVGQLADVPTQEQVVEMLNVGERTVRRAREVLNEGVPEVISAVERGAVSVSAAANVARLPEPKQREIISTGTKPVTAAVRDIRTADQTPKMESRLKRQGERQAPFHNRRKP
jgi:hypothetical protein